MRKSESPSNRLSPRGRRTIQYIVTN
ncbi:chemotaxis protein, partial [Yersinia pestis]